jgi:TetR/AcrR family transcriptional regulator
MTRSTTTSRRQKEKEDRKEHILTAAREVFFHEGIHRATVDANAEVAKGTVYLYFPTKETLLAYLLLEGLDDLGARLMAAFGEDAPLTGEERLRQLGNAYYAFYLAKPDYFRLMMAFDRRHFQESVKADVYGMILHRSLRSLKWAVDAVDQGMREGQFRPGDARQQAGMFWAALNGVLVLTSHPLRRELVEQEVETLYGGVLETMIRGFKQ